MGIISEDKVEIANVVHTMMSADGLMMPGAIFKEFYDAYCTQESRKKGPGFFCCLGETTVIDKLKRAFGFHRKNFTDKVRSDSKAHIDKIKAEYKDFWSIALEKTNAISGTKKVFNKIDQYFAQQAFLLAWAVEQEKKLDTVPNPAESVLVTKIKKADYSSSKDMLDVYQTIKTNRCGSDTITAFNAVSSTLVDPFINAPFKAFLQDFVVQYQIQRRFRLDYAIQQDVRDIIKAINSLEPNVSLNVMQKIYNKIVKIKNARPTGSTAQALNILKEDPFAIAIAIASNAKKSEFLVEFLMSSQEYAATDESTKALKERILKALDVSSQDPVVKALAMNKVYAELKAHYKAEKAKSFVNEVHDNVIVSIFESIEGPNPFETAALPVRLSHSRK